jgi:hypothetical protein
LWDVMYDRLLDICRKWNELNPEREVNVAE